MKQHTRFDIYLSALACALTASSCGATKRTSDVHPTPPLKRFVGALERGESIYGLDAGCSEWLGEPGEPEIVLEPDAEEASDGEASATNAGNGERAHDDGWRLHGRLKTRVADAQGRMYGFSYYLRDDSDPIRMRVVGRGSWSPAPGVMIEDPKNKGYFLIGTGRYCVVEVEVREHPHDQEAILVGDEAWFLSRDACLRYRSGRLAGSPGCSDMKPRPTAP